MAASPNAQPFRAFNDARNCTTYDQWPFGFRNRTSYSASQSDDQLAKQSAARPTIYLLGGLDILPLAGTEAFSGVLRDPTTPPAATARSSARSQKGMAGPVTSEYVRMNQRGSCTRLGVGDANRNVRQPVRSTRSGCVAEGVGDLRARM